MYFKQTQHIGIFNSDLNFELNAISVVFSYNQILTFTELVLFYHLHNSATYDIYHLTIKCLF